MPEKPSKTSNHQRLKEMMCHLTPQNALVPYNICFDANANFWVASKGGLFKFDSSGANLLFSMKNDFPRKMAAYAQVLHFDSKIIYTCAEDRTALTVFRILTLDGHLEKEHFIEGKIQSLTINPKGEMFMTKQHTANANESNIWRAHIDHPLAWEELCSTFDECFQTLCSYDDDTLAVAVASAPVNMYSKQSIKWINVEKSEIIGTFGKSGKNDGEVYFPRCMRRHGDSLLVMDKTGRIQEFTRTGNFVTVSAKIDDYIGNGFTIRDGKAIIACSGIVQDKASMTICDDWVEEICLDGSRWTAEE